MCGFVGFTNHIGSAVGTADVIEKMMNRIAHRGPDQAGNYCDEAVAMGFRRLSIIDLSEAGSQPMTNEDGSIVITFNGEIYNHAVLRDELKAAGHIFASRADTEVLIHGYEEWGLTGLLGKLRGMFAFVIYDKRDGSLCGARDFFGIKPLYYGLFGETFMWGSEIKSFLDHPAFERQLNTDVLETYLTFQYSPTSETFFKNVYKLPAAHCFTYKDGQLEIKRYWEIKFTPDEEPTLENWVDKITETFKDSVSAHKIADVEVGSFLSSGVDSSYVAAVADVDKTFTVGFGEDEKYNEIGYAKEFSKYIGKENTSMVISPEDFWGTFAKIQYQMDEPLADPAAAALYFVCKIASEKVKVVLSGEGADEIFGGYNIYHNPDDMALYEKLPKALRRAAGRAVKNLPQKRGVNFIERGSKSLQERFIGNAYMFTPEERKALLRHPTDAPDPTEITKPFYDKAAHNDPVTQMQYLDLHLWMTGDILLKADKMSMAHSLELRVPFLDRKVMELAERIPKRFRVTKENTKYAMRLAAMRACPPQTANKKKLGFPVPTRVWLKEDEYYSKVKARFLSEDSERFFHTEQLIKLLDEHRAGKYDHSRKIWTVYTFLVWYEVYFNDGYKTFVS